MRAIPATEATTAAAASTATGAATTATAVEIIREIEAEVAGELRARLRARLLRQPAEWLVDELLARIDLRTTPVPATAAAAGEADAGEADAATDAEGTHAALVDEDAVSAFIARHRPLTRDRLEQDGYLHAPATPCQGTAVIAAHCRTPAGDALLRDAKALLDALLFGDEAGGVRLTRVQRELLTITLARPKADALAGLLRATTEIDAEGTWRDPERVSHDTRAPNTVIEVEYGETASEIVGRGIALALRLINDLEINEQILYARMANIEDSSLVSHA